MLPLHEFLSRRRAPAQLVLTKIITRVSSGVKAELSELSTHLLSAVDPVSDAEISLHILRILSGEYGCFCGGSQA